MAKKDNSTKINISASDRNYYIVSGIVLSIILLAVLYPLIYVLSASFSDGAAVTSGQVVLWPVDFSLEGYKAVFEYPEVWNSYLNTIFYTVVGTFINICMVFMAAYPMSRPNLKGRNAIMMIFTFTMFFNGGMIPMFILICDLNMYDTIWALLIPGALSVYNMIIARTFIQSNVPNELYEAASIDGCGDGRFFFTMVLPLSKALVAVIGLFSAVTHWNAYFNAMMYLSNRSLIPLQIILREILIMNQFDPSTVSDPELALQLATLADVLKYSLIVVATVPILCVYPFIQKYFVKGVMIGSIKG